MTNFFRRILTLLQLHLILIKVNIYKEILRCYRETLVLSHNIIHHLDIGWCVLYNSSVMGRGGWSLIRVSSFNSGSRSPALADNVIQEKYRKKRIGVSFFSVPQCRLLFFSKPQRHKEKEYRTCFLFSFMKRAHFWWAKKQVDHCSSWPVHRHTAVHWCFYSLTILLPSKFCRAEMPFLGYLPVTPYSLPFVCFYPGIVRSSADMMGKQQVAFYYVYFSYYV